MPCSFEIKQAGTGEALSHPPMANSSGPDRLFEIIAAHAPCSARKAIFSENVEAGSLSERAIHGFSIRRPSPFTASFGTWTTLHLKGTAGNSQLKAAATDWRRLRQCFGETILKVDVSSGNKLTRSKWR